MGALGLSSPDQRHVWDLGLEVQRLGSSPLRNLRIAFLLSVLWMSGQGSL